ncbi:hypothetical protein ACFL07_01275 [Pseudomonadota bacterium]
MNTFRIVLALFLILMAGTVFAAPRGGDGATDLMRGYYSCYKVNTEGDYLFRMNVQSATFIEPDDFDNTIELGPLFDCSIKLDRIGLLAAPYCQSEYLNASSLLMVCKGTREEMVGLLADLQADVLNPAP